MADSVWRLWRRRKQSRALQSTAPKAKTTVGGGKEGCGGSLRVEGKAELLVDVKIGGSRRRRRRRPDEVVDGVAGLVHGHHILGVV
uniref:Uncharacterized protein n=1 Tax=Arundo donax TaxID=35708 RepID=A0A0A9U4N6_ARUDO